MSLLLGMPDWARFTLGILEFVLLLGLLASLTGALLCGLRLAWLLIEPGLTGRVLGWRARWIIRRARPSRRRHPMEHII